MSLDIDTVFGQSADLIKETRTTDGLGGVTSVSETQYSITCSIQPLNFEERKLYADGINTVGAVKVYLKCSYTDDSGDSFTPAVGDIILYNSTRYRIEELNEWSIGSSVMYYKAVCSKI